MLLFVIHPLWSIIGDSGFVVSLILPSTVALLSFHRSTGKLGSRPPRTGPHPGGLRAAAHRLWGTRGRESATHRLRFWLCRRTACPHGTAVCECQRLFLACQHGDSGASARSVGTPHPLYRPWCRVAGAPPRRRPRRSRLYFHPSVVRRHHGHSTLTSGTLGEAGRPRAPAARPSRALWGLPRATQPPAWGDPSHPAPTGDGRGGNADENTVLALG